MTEAIDWVAVRNEVVQHLQALIRLDTTNPPGNETVAAAYLADEQEIQLIRTVQNQVQQSKVTMTGMSPVSRSSSGR